MRHSKASMALILPLMATLALAGCSQPKPKVSEAENARAVRVVQLQSQAITGAITASGDLVSREEAAVLPEVNGYQVCRAIKRVAPNTPVVILTAKTDPADRFWAMQSGADAFLNKPIDPATVVEKLKALLDGT